MLLPSKLLPPMRERGRSPSGVDEELCRLIASGAITAASGPRGTVLALVVGARPFPRRAQAIVNCSAGDPAARLAFTPINQSRRSIAVLDFMMWVTVLGCLIIGGLLAWALARTINYLHRSRR
jgi:hypothetical protein